MFACAMDRRPHACIVCYADNSVKRYEVLDFSKHLELLQKAGEQLMRETTHS